MSRIIAIANQKGGVGKTTTCVNLACALKMKGKRVLLVDCDPQGNSSSGMGVDKNSTPGAYELLIKNADTLDCIRHTPYGDVIPSNKELSGASVELVRQEKREFVLKNALQMVYNDYDYIFIDCPPSLELLTLKGIRASFVLYKKGTGVYMSARSLGEVNVQVILEALGGGGNSTTAGGQAENITVEEAKAKLLEAIDHYLEN